MIRFVVSGPQGLGFNWLQRLGLAFRDVGFRFQGGGHGEQGTILDFLFRGGG